MGKIIAVILILLVLAVLVDLWFVRIIHQAKKQDDLISELLQKLERR